MLRRRTLAESDLNENVQIKRYSFIGNKERQKQIPLDFEPETVIFYDNYPNDYYLENGTLSFGDNTGYAFHIKSKDFQLGAMPYSTNAANVNCSNREAISYTAGTLTLNPFSAYKSFAAGHKYTVIIIGSVTEEVLT